MAYSLLMSVNEKRTLISDFQVDLSGWHAKQIIFSRDISTWKFTSLLTFNLRDEFNLIHALEPLFGWNASTGMDRSVKITRKIRFEIPRIIFSATRKQYMGLVLKN